MQDEEAGDCNRIKKSAFASRGVISKFGPSWQVRAPNPGGVWRVEDIKKRYVGTHNTGSWISNRRRWVMLSASRVFARTVDKPLM